jgi:hypothetical protein
VWCLNGDGLLLPCFDISLPLKKGHLAGWLAGWLYWLVVIFSLGWSLFSYKEVGRWIQLFF